MDFHPLFNPNVKLYSEWQFVDEGYFDNAICHACLEILVLEVVAFYDN